MRASARRHAAFSLLRRRLQERRSLTATRDRPDAPDLLQTQESLHTASQTSSQTHLPDLLQTQESLHMASKTNLPKTFSQTHYPLGGPKNSLLSPATLQ